MHEGLDGRIGAKVKNAPQFAVEDAIRIGREIYGLEALASELPSERDQNFRLQEPGGAEHVLKIANALESPEVLDLQNQAIAYLAARQTGLTVSTVGFYVCEARARIRTLLDRQ